VSPKRAVSFVTAASCWPFDGSAVRGRRSTPRRIDLQMLELLHSIASDVRALTGEVRALRESLPIPLVDVATLRASPV
jgi:hypothetical protein